MTQTAATKFCRGCRVLRVLPNAAYSYRKMLSSPQPFATQAHVGRVNVLGGQGQPQGFEACCDGILQPGPHVSQDLVATWQPHSTQQPVHSSRLFIMIDRSITRLMPSTLRLAPRKKTPLSIVSGLIRDSKFQSKVLRTPFLSIDSSCQT